MDDRIENLKKFLSAPKDISKSTNLEKASTLALHFIGYIARPVGIDEELYNDCLNAFCNHRGKFEWEEKAIYDTLQENEKKRN